MRTARIVGVPIRRMSKRPLRVILSGIGVAFAIAAFTVARFMSESSEAELRSTIARSQGVAATLSVSLPNYSMVDEEVVETLTTAISDITRSEPTVIYLSSGYGSCPDEASFPSLGVIEGPLTPLVESLSDIPEGTNDFLPSAIGLGPAQEVALCIPEDLRLTVTALQDGPWRGIDLEEGMILLPQPREGRLGLAPHVTDLKRRAGTVRILSLVPSADVDSMIGLITQSASSIVDISGRQIEFDVRRVDSSEDFDNAQAVLSVVLTAIALLAMAAGVVGVSTAQLAALPLRLRQLALYHALGASNADTVLIVAIESAVIVAIGGVSGVVLSIAGLAVIDEFFGDALLVDFGLAGATPIWQALAVTIPFMFATGLIPALRARRDLLQTAREL